MPLADTADSRVAGHLADRLDRMGNQQSLGTGASRGQRCLGTGMAAADNDHVKCFGILHGKTTDPMISSGSSSRND